MRQLATIVFFLTASVYGQSVLLRPIQVEGGDNKALQNLAGALEKDVYEVLTARGLQIVSEATLKIDPPRPGVCSEACLMELAQRAKMTRILVPVLQRKKDSENFLCYLYTVQEGRITENNVLVLFINLPEARRRTAIASVMVELFPELARTAVVREVPATKPPITKEKEKEETSSGSIRLLSDPAGAEVFVDGVRVGTTPIDLPANGKMQSVRIALANYDEIVFPVRASAKSEVMFTLQKADRTARSSQSSSTQAPLPASSGPYWGAFARSLILPGWGQYSKGSDSGFWFGLGSAVFAGTAVYADHQARLYRNKYVSSARATQVYLLGSPSATNQTVIAFATFSYLSVPVSGSVSDLKNCTSGVCSDYRQMHTITRASAGLFAAIYFWGLFDALLADTSSKRSSVTFSALPVAFGSDRGAMFGARVRF